MAVAVAVAVAVATRRGVVVMHLKGAAACNGCVPWPFATTTAAGSRQQERTGRARRF